MKIDRKLIAQLFGFMFASITIIQCVWSGPVSPPNAPSSIHLDGGFDVVTCDISAPQLHRITYSKPVTVLPSLCRDLAAYQVRSCIGINYTEWKGVANNYSVCEEIENSSENGPLWQISSLVYKGGFRVTTGKHGDSAASTTDFSAGAFAISEAGDSIFLSGRSSEPRIAEILIPEIINTVNPQEMAVAYDFKQNFELFHDPINGYDSGINNFFRFTGLYAIDGKLIVNAFNWYDANGTETDTTSVYADANNLAGSKIGPFQLEGAARSAGWVSPVPLKWQPRLGGTHVSGWSQGSINSRLSNGPSAYFWNPLEDALDPNITQPGPIAARVGLTFPLNNILFDYGLYGSTYTHSFAGNEEIMLNRQLNNDLWTYLSGASYGFIVPGTNTYVTLGFNGGINSGIGYKWEYAPGKFCSGHCPKDPEDRQNYYWLWKLSDLERAVNGEIQPYEVRPYDFGALDTKGVKAHLGGGSYNPNTGRLIISLRGGDEVGTYARPPLFLVYDVLVN